ncbi:Predicted arabinose efflux permease, MFS family [Seinonella peptonophila]|uniref:Predicted arabinose efflux permease, MFS family n=1 Tax=Seinonella peptonophila TaxID=112248 RepID=A0A1M5A988_9BACL|nr:MFS transporter [Seinonella peptonophila]SHF26606.1 Predicted arabinose efflux permease, MFS family [Seinonella peptonophila]
MGRLWTSSFIILTISMLFLFTSVCLLIPTLPFFIKNLGGTESQVGIIVGTFTISAVIFRPIIGGFLDRYGRKPFIVFGLILFLVLMCFYNWVSGLWILILLRFLHGIGWAISTTSIGTAVTDIVPTTRRGEGMGWYGLAMTISMAVGPMLGIWLLQKYSFHGLFSVAIFFSIIALLLGLILKLPIQFQHKARRIELFDSSMFPVGLAIVFLTIPYGGITAFLPLFVESIKVNAGTFFLMYAVSLSFIRPIAGKLTDRYDESVVIKLSVIISSMALLVLSFSSGLVGVIFSAILYGIGFGSAQPAIQTYMINLARPDRKGIANASYFTSFDLGIGLGAIILGWIYPFIGYQYLFIVCAISIMISYFMLVIILRRTRKITSHYNYLKTNNPKNLSTKDQQM